MIHELDYQQKTSFVDLLVHYMSEDVSSRDDRICWENFFKELKPLGLGRLKGDVIAFWMNSQAANVRSKNSMLRLLHPVEKEIISSGAYGYMLELYRIGILTDSLFEDVVNQCMMETMLPVSAQQIKSIVANVLAQIFSDLEIQSSH